MTHCSHDLEECRNAGRKSRNPAEAHFRPSAARRGYRGDPLGTIAFYGPDNQHASKLVVGISPSANAGITETRSFCNPDADVRSDAQVLANVLAYLTGQRVKSLVITDGICGCPHEEGVDYPEGAACEYCEYWRGRARDVPLIG